MYSKTRVNKELTLATFGYNPDDLSVGSHAKIVCTCTNCDRNIHKEYRNVDSKHRCPAVVGSSKRCYKCDTWKDITFFNKNPKGSGGVAKMCRECHNSHQSVKNAERSRQNRLRNAVIDGDIDFYIRKKLYRLRSMCKREKIDFNLDLDYLYDKWNNNYGKCFYTNIPMNNSMEQQGFQCWNGPSLDRLNPSLGYTKGNIVWCIFAVNSFKGSLTLEQFKDQVSNISWNFTRE